MSTKSPVMILNEFAARHRMPPPDYRISLPGTHPNEFRCEVHVAHISATGLGSSKQAAKHEAASQALKHVSELQIDIIPMKKIKEEYHDKSALLKMTSNLNSNHIGLLNEYCDENKLARPEYRELFGVGPSHSPVFTIQCALNALKTEGRAKNKKQAKQLAAREMLEQLCTGETKFFFADTNEIESKLDVKEFAIKKEPTFEATESRIDGRELNSDLEPKLETDVKLRHLPISVKKERTGTDMFRELLIRETWKAVDVVCSSLGIQYEVENIQAESPVVMSAVFGTETPVAMMAMGDSELEVRAKLLQEIFMGFNVFANEPDDST